MPVPDDAQPAFLDALFGLGPQRKKSNFHWESALAECEIGDFQIVPLTTSRLLRAEGRAMRHCVGNYDELCHQGRARVFSIRDLACRRVATASLIWRDDYWHLDQIKGPRNAEVLESERTFFDGDSTVTVIEQTEVYYVGHEVLRLYRQAWDSALGSYVRGLLIPLRSGVTDADRGTPPKR